MDERYEAGEELDQTQFLLGNVNVQTTERYIGCTQTLRMPSMIESGSNRTAASSVILADFT